MRKKQKESTERSKTGGKKKDRGKGTRQEDARREKREEIKKK